MIPDPAPPYEVSIVGRAQMDIIDLLSRAKPLGLFAELEQVLFQVDEHLHQRPREWGDPIRNFPAAQSVQYRGQVDPIIAYYSVHDRLPMVFLNWVTVPKGHPLARSGS